MGANPGNIFDRGRSAAYRQEPSGDLTTKALPTARNLTGRTAMTRHMATLAPSARIGWQPFTATEGNATGCCAIRTSVLCLPGLGDWLRDDWRACAVQVVIDPPAHGPIHGVAGQVR